MTDFKQVDGVSWKWLRTKNREYCLVCRTKKGSNDGFNQNEVLRPLDVNKLSKQQVAFLTRGVDLNENTEFRKLFNLHDEVEYCILKKGYVATTCIDGTRFRSEPIFETSKMALYHRIKRIENLLDEIFNPS